MKVLFDHQAFENQTFGGISRYHFELINNFQEEHNIRWNLPIKHSENVYLNELEDYKNKLLPNSKKIDFCKEFLGGIEFKGKRRIYNLKTKLFPEPKIIASSVINKELVIQELKKGDFDVFHPTFYDPYFLEYIGNKPFVITVYDLIDEIYPELLMYHIDNKDKKMLERAAKIIAISESTKNDLINIYGISENKIEVIYLANSLNPTIKNSLSDFKIKLPQKYLLYVGNRHIYKNFYFFARMVSVLKEEEPDLHIVCTGSKFSEEDLFYFKKLKIENKVHHFYVNDEELVTLYQNAYAFVFPSLYEGFGIPVLESFSCGCPVLASNTSSLKEIGGDAVLYFDPKNPESMLKSFKKILQDTHFREELITKGYKKNENFSWKKTALATLAVYRSVI